RAAAPVGHVGVLRRLGSEDIPTVPGGCGRVAAVRSFPKPVRGGRLPVVPGGESRAALARAAQYGDGWHGFNLSPEGRRPSESLCSGVCCSVGSVIPPRSRSWWHRSRSRFVPPIWSGIMLLSTTQSP